MKKILIDCDPGIDDALAIVLAINSGKVSLQEISTTHGTGSVEQTARNALRVIEYLGLDTRVNEGSAKPFYVDPLPPTPAHGKDGLGETRLLPSSPSRKPVRELPADFLSRGVSSGASTLVATGPLTNVAHAFQAQPEIMNSLEELIIMGGVFDAPGNMGRISEFNFYADPHAADYVLTKTNVKKILVPLNITRQVILTPEMNEQFSETKSGKLASSMVPHYQSFSQRIGLLGCALHDPLAMGYAIDPSFLKLTPREVVVEPKGEYTRGACVVESRKRHQTEPNVLVATDVDSSRFLEYFIQTISK